MTRHYPDLGSASDWLNEISHTARPIRSPTKIWVVTRHQYGISFLKLHLAGKPEVASPNVGCFLRLLGIYSQGAFELPISRPIRRVDFKIKILLKLRFGKFSLGSRFFHLYFACDDFAFEIPSR